MREISEEKASRVWGTEWRVAEASRSIRVITQGKDDEICIALIRKGLAPADLEIMLESSKEFFKFMSDTMRLLNLKH